MVPDNPLNVKKKPENLLLNLGTCFLQNKAPTAYKKTFLDHFQIESDDISLDELQELLFTASVKPMSLYNSVAEIVWAPQIEWHDIVQIFYEDVACNCYESLKKTVKKYTGIEIDAHNFHKKFDLIGAQYLLSGQGPSWRSFIFIAHILEYSASQAGELFSLNKDTDFYSAIPFSKFCQRFVLEKEEVFFSPMPVFQNFSNKLQNTCSGLSEGVTLITVSTAAELAGILVELFAEAQHFNIAVRLRFARGSILIGATATPSAFEVLPSALSAPTLLVGHWKLLELLKEILGASFYCVALEAYALENHSNDLKRLMTRHYARSKFYECYNGTRAQLGAEGLSTLSAAVIYNDRKWLQGALLSLTGSTVTSYTLLNEKQKGMIKKHMPDFSLELEKLSQQLPLFPVNLLETFYESSANIPKFVTGEDFLRYEPKSNAIKKYKKTQKNLINAIKNFTKKQPLPLDDLYKRMIGFLFTQYGLHSHEDGQAFISEAQAPIATISFSSAMLLKLLERNFIQPFTERGLEPLVPPLPVKGCCYGMVGAFTAYTLGLGLQQWVSTIFELLCFTDPRLPRFTENETLSAEKKNHIEALCFFIWHVQSPDKFTFMPPIKTLKDETQCFEASFEVMRPLFWPNAKPLRFSNKQGSFYTFTEFYDELHLKIENLKKLKDPFVIHFTGQVQLTGMNLHATALYVHPVENIYYYFCPSTLFGQYCYHIDELAEKIRDSFRISFRGPQSFIIAFKVYTASKSLQFQQLALATNEAEFRRHLTLPNQMTVEHYLAAFSIIDEFYKIIPDLVAQEGYTPLCQIPGVMGCYSLLGISFLSKKYEAVRICCSLIQTYIPDQFIRDLFALTNIPMDARPKDFMQIMLLSENPMVQWCLQMHHVVKALPRQQLVELYQELSHQRQKHQLIFLLQSLQIFIPLTQRKSPRITTQRKECHQEPEDLCIKPKLSKKRGVFLSQSAVVSRQSPTQESVNAEWVEPLKKAKK